MGAAPPRRRTRAPTLRVTPAHQAKAGGAPRLTRGLELGLDGRLTGRQWLRGDEANETAPLPTRAVLSARLGLEVGAWEMTAIVTNLLDSRKATFGTFKEKRGTGELERFLTPLNARCFRLVVGREIDLLGGG